MICLVRGRKMYKNGVIVPCYGCDQRSGICHSNCERYREFIKKNREVREKREDFFKQYYGYRRDGRKVQL